jgi:hypothetical protein
MVRRVPEFDRTGRRKGVIPLEKRCTAKRKDGQPCTAAATSTGRCPAHEGLGIAASRQAASEAGKSGGRAAKQQAAARRREEELHKRGLASALRARAVEHRAELLDALFAPILDPTTPPKARQEAALKVWERAFGRPGQSPPVAEGEEIADLTIDELVEAWESFDEQHYPDQQVGPSAVA